MRWALLLCVGCSFTHGATVTVDGPVDTPPDSPDAAITWTVDSTSGKACPATTAEWSSFIAAKGLGIEVPTSLWTMQDTSGSLVDAAGTVALAPYGPTTYQRAVPGWSRLAVATTDGFVSRWGNTTDSGLPDVSSKSMMVLMYYATEKTPSTIRTVLIAGSGSSSSYAEVDLDTSDHFELTASTGAATGTMDHGTAVIPLVLTLDQAHSEQHLIVDREVIAPTYTPLGSSKGLYLASANWAAPEGRWLYMAAWYGPSAELGDAKIDALLTALGW